MRNILFIDGIAVVNPDIPVDRDLPLGTHYYYQDSHFWRLKCEIKPFDDKPGSVYWKRLKVEDVPAHIRAAALLLQ